MRKHFLGALGADASGIPYIVLGEDWYFDFSEPEVLRRG